MTATYDARIEANVQVLASWVAEMTHGHLTATRTEVFGFAHVRIQRTDGQPLYTMPEQWKGEGPQPVTGIASAVQLPYRPLDRRHKVTMRELAEAVRDATVRLDAPDQLKGQLHGWRYDWQDANRI